MADPLLEPSARARFQIGRLVTVAAIAILVITALARFETAGAATGLRYAGGALAAIGGAFATYGALASTASHRRGWVAVGTGAALVAAATIAMIIIRSMGES